MDFICKDFDIMKMPDAAFALAALYAEFGERAKYSSLAINGTKSKMIMNMSNDELLTYILRIEDYKKRGCYEKK